jgi:uncharacterized protein (DUF885 family)
MMTPSLARSIILLMALLLSAALSATPMATLADSYLEAYFRMFPTLATAAGRHDLDKTLEDLSRSRLEGWVEFNRSKRAQLLELMRREDASLDDRLDAEALLSQIDRELNAQTVLRRPERDPLYWSSIIANATVFLLVRDDLPLQDRQLRARARARLLPRLTGQAREAFAHVESSQVAADFCRIAAGQLRGSSRFYVEGFPSAVGGGSEAEKEGKDAAAALGELADLLEDLAKRATGSPRLGAVYARTFRLGTGVEEPVANVLARARTDLEATRREAASYGRQVWSNLIATESPPADDLKLLRRLFDRVAADRDASVDESLAEWRKNVQEIEAFVRKKNVITLPDPLTLIVERSPSFFVGQSVGGVYPPGPYAPEAKTILFLPTPPTGATAVENDAFFRDFNRHFNKMIVAHELIPGHYVQFKIAARQPHKVRAVFPDPLYVEGWGTFCERLLLDEGWGGPLPRLAHLKKQLENISRTIVDIRVHTENLSREDVVKFVKDEALQDDQFAANMWTRALTSSPQITTYYLGYSKVRKIYDITRAAEGEKFDLHKFMDGMMELGPVRLDHYLERASIKRSPAGPRGD